MTPYHIPRSDFCYMPKRADWRKNPNYIPQFLILKQARMKELMSHKCISICTLILNTIQCPPTIYDRNQHIWHKFDHALWYIDLFVRISGRGKQARIGYIVCIDLWRLLVASPTLETMSANSMYYVLYRVKVLLKYSLEVFFYILISLRTVSV